MAPSHSNGSESSVRATLVVMRKLVPLVCLSSAAPVILAPYSLYNGLNFWAERHTTLRHQDIHCELTPQAQYCKDAILDEVAMNQRMGVIVPCMHLVTWPALGVLSDSYGRRPVILLCFLVAFLSIFMVFLFVFFDVSLYWYFVVNPFAAFPPGVVWYAYTTDITNLQNRAPALGMLSGLDVMSKVIGTSIGGLLTLKQACAASTATWAALCVVCWICLTESLPPEKRTPFQRQDLHKLLPWKGVAIMCRNRLLTGFTLVLICYSATSGVILSLGPSYVVKYLNFAASDNVINSLITQIASTIWLSIFLGKISNWFGDGAVLLLGTWCFLLYTILFAFCNEKWHLYLLNSVFVGPSSLTIPGIAVLKSKLVDDHEQGVLQGALTTVGLVVSTIFGPIFSGLFLVYNRSNVWTPFSGALIILGSLFLIPGLIMVPKLNKKVMGEMLLRDGSLSLTSPEI